MKQKQRATDFTPDCLPNTRIKLFFDLLRNRWSTLLSLALIFLLSAAPLIIFRYYNLLIVTSVTGEVTSGIMTEQEGSAILIQYGNIERLVSIPLLTLIALAVAGSMRIIKKLGFGRGVSLWYDFFNGIKENGLPFCIAAVVLGALGYLSGILNPPFAPKGVLCLLPAVMLAVIGLPVALIFISVTAVYRDKWGKRLTSSIALYLKSLPSTLLALICVISPLALLLIGNTFVQLIVPFAYAFLMPAILLAWFLYCCFLFDIHINAKYFPELVRKGLADK